ncbi:hypothetical protein NPIL_13621 [Nephila pilipes]|uniref:Uncharacterized protein n=1 Tax=Nephila pilipes TaxID=299642 RepID=A0A8X6QND3_NEPPI|nr:hypothetical protein NPIL_13621 [Nephila pilipes]
MRNEDCLPPHDGNRANYNDDTLSSLPVSTEGEGVIPQWKLRGRDSSALLPVYEKLISRRGALAFGGWAGITDLEGRYRFNATRSLILRGGGDNRIGKGRKYTYFLLFRKCIV